MAFNKRTWKGRQGTGLNKFSINGATPVTVINQPDSVTEQGDALSAGNLNDLEDRIDNAFEEIADGTQVVGKATADASGNVITDTYETKADASDLKDAIDNNSQRIENLEVAVSGSLVQTNTDATMANTKTITNANEILPWAILKRVGARAVVWNQLCPKFTARTQVVGDVTWTIDEDGVVSATWSTTLSENSTFAIFSSTDAWGASIPQGHKFLVGNKPSNTATQIRFAFYDMNNSLLMDTGITNADSKRIFTMQNGDAVKLYYALRIVANTPAGTAKFYPQFFDLTAMKMESLTADQFRALFPASYYPYDTGSIIPLNPSAFKVVGKNKFSNTISIISGGGYYSSGDMYLPKGSYILTFKNVSAYNISYWLNGNNVSDTATKSVSAGASATLSFSMSEGGIMSFGGRHNPLDSSVQVSDLSELMIRPASTSADYEPYSTVTVDTSVLAGSHYVNSSCYDYVENVMENGVTKGKKHTVVGSYTFTGNEAWTTNGDSKTTQVVADIIKYCGNIDTPNIVCAVLVVATGKELFEGTVTSGIGQNGYGVRVGANDVALLTGQTIYFEKATESVTDVDPIPNIPCEDGTTITAVTPQTDLVNAIDVPSTIAYMTKISS